MIIEQERHFAKKPKLEHVPTNDKPSFLTHFEEATRNGGYRGKLHELHPASIEKQKRIQAERGEKSTTQNIPSETTSSGINDQLRGFWKELGIDDKSIKENLSDTSRQRHEIPFPKIS